MVEIRLSGRAVSLAGGGAAFGGSALAAGARGGAGALRSATICRDF